MICQRLADEAGLEASVASMRRYVRRHFPEHARRAEVEVHRPATPPGAEAQVDYGYLGAWFDPRAGRRVEPFFAPAPHLRFADFRDVHSPEGRHEMTTQQVPRGRA